MSRDRPVMLGHAGDEGLGPPRHRAGAGSVSEKGGCHADGERSRSDAECGGQRPTAAACRVGAALAQRYRSAGTHSP